MNNEEPNRESLIIHIEGLQVTLGKRNRRIAELEEKLASPEFINTVAVQKAYKRGWQEASQTMMKLSTDAAKSLRQIREDAWRVYLEGEHK